MADEAAVPALGLSRSPSEYPASTHASALAAHLVYGFTTDLVRRAFVTSRIRINAEYLSSSGSAHTKYNAKHNSAASPDDPLNCRDGGLSAVKVHNQSGPVRHAARRS